MKEEIRKTIDQIRTAMSKNEVEVKSAKIEERLYGTQHYQSAVTIMTYVSFHNEVGTRNIMSACFDDGKNVVVPICGPNYTLLPVKIKGFEDLEPGTMGILEPTKKKVIVDINRLDLILVPGIAFDRMGNRVGYGLAYYDRFLKKFSPSTVKIALAYDFQVVPSVPHEKHDQVVDLIITEKEIIHCQ
ncbi:MAG: 5-formyltetrahydrofolate cyclo-ligase [Clostridia bacterium]|nr:5-formyltetrahydrofolate cyclo-ligase [Clostridia bacterium]